VGSVRNDAFARPGAAGPVGRGDTAADRTSPGRISAPTPTPEKKVRRT
jgi:hypothetical protein